MFGDPRVGQTGASFVAMGGRENSGNDWPPSNTCGVYYYTMYTECGVLGDEREEGEKRERERERESEPESRLSLARDKEGAMDI